MPVGVAAIGAAGVIGAGYLAKRGSDNANKTAAASQDKSMKYQMDRQAVEDKRYADAWQDYQTRHAAWEARNFGGAKPAGGGAPAAASPSGAMRFTGMDLGPTGGGSSLATLLSPQGAMAPQAAPSDQEKTTGWNDWGRYGAGGL